MNNSAPSKDRIQIEVLHKIGEVLGSDSELEHSLHKILQLLEERLEMGLGTLTLPQGDSEVSIDIAHGLSPSEIERGRYKIGEGITGRVVKSGKPVIVPRISSEPLFLDRTGARADREKSQMSFICIPILLQLEVVGTLSVDTPYLDDARLEQNVRLLSIIATMIAQAVAARRTARRERANLLDENLRLQRELKERFHPSNVVGNSRAMQEVCDLIGKVAPSDATVLLRGESGTGKELIADAVHYASLRASKPFIKVHVAALPESLIESELFGHERGAFTGATEAKIGRFERAEGGSIFLDEIGELNPSIQVKLLRVIQTREIERLGGTELKKVDVRIIAATHVDLENAVAQGHFREDLFYRLNVVPINVPSLRECKDDLALFIERFAEQIAAQNGMAPCHFSDDALKIMKSYHWPGNMRQLRNVIEWVMIMKGSGEPVEKQDLPSDLLQAEPVKGDSAQVGNAQSVQTYATQIASILDVPLKEARNVFERDYLGAQLDRFDGNISKTADFIGMERSALHRKIKQLQLHSPNSNVSDNKNLKINKG
ncbi:MAG TPA: sigma-54-dependent Fis family transcriptional regulator [Rhodospirillaceae bacterium]|nr:sigma-54-dependent Fis family transcriptional regulator [Rhodospirillaceae bacterium]